MPLRHHTLVAWQHADDLFIELHQLTLKSFPTHEKFELGRQTRRAAFSIAVNIVEGCARRLGYVTPDRLTDFEKSLNQLGAIVPQLPFQPL